MYSKYLRTQRPPVFIHSCINYLSKLNIPVLKVLVNVFTYACTKSGTVVIRSFSHVLKVSMYSKVLLYSFIHLSTTHSNLYLCIPSIHVFIQVLHIRSMYSKYSCASNHASIYYLFKISIYVLKVLVYLLIVCIFNNSFKYQFKSSILVFNKVLVYSFVHVHSLIYYFFLHPTMNKVFRVYSLFDMLCMHLLHSFCTNLS